MQKSEFNNIVFFDGVCSLCNSGVDFLIKRDKNSILKFASLQGENAKIILPKEFTSDLDTFVFYANGNIYTKSSAAIKVLVSLGGLWKLINIFKIFPPIIRDVLYNFIAQNRYKWFGIKESCRIPTPKETARFLN